jgi:hypothetical protein
VAARVRGSEWLLGKCASEKTTEDRDFFRRAFAIAQRRVPFGPTKILRSHARRNAIAQHFPRSHSEPLTRTARPANGHCGGNPRNARRLSVMYLLDINVLLAFRYVAHVHHLRAKRWIYAIQSLEPHPFATCSIVELGFIRIASGGSRLAANLIDARADLRNTQSDLKPKFLPDDLDADQLPGWVTRFSIAKFVH